MGSTSMFLTRRKDRKLCSRGGSEDSPLLTGNDKILQNQWFVRISFLKTGGLIRDEKQTVSLY